MTTTERTQAAARILFMLGHSAPDIGRQLDVHENTVLKWAKKLDWAAERNRQTNQKKLWLARMNVLIDYQHEALEAITHRERTEGTLEPLASVPVTTLTRMYQSIWHDGLSWDQVVFVMRNFHEYLGRIDPDLVRAIIPHTDEFLNQKRALMGVD